MGYYTDYTLTTTKEVRQAVEASSGYSNWSDGELTDSKWYTHEEDCRQVSKQFPEALIQLEGIGEEKGDLWCKYFKNGKMQTVVAEIVFAPFDESALK